jgi:hypothetical protein
VARVQNQVVTFFTFKQINYLCAATNIWRVSTYIFGDEISRMLNFKSIQALFDFEYA